MAQRPTVADLVGWLGVQSPEPVEEEPTDTEQVLADVLAAALEEIEGSLRDDAIPDDVDEYPARVRTAVLLYASRLFKRRSSPEGIADFGELGAVPVRPLDPDIVKLIRRLQRLDGFA